MPCGAVDCCAPGARGARARSASPSRPRRGRTAAAWSCGRRPTAAGGSLAGRLPCAVVSVGNLTVGGTGKTPAVEMVARWLTDDGRRVAIVSRGYGRRPGAPVELVSDGGAPRLPAERAGDEPLLLARRLPGVAVVVGADRLRAGQWTVANLRPDVVLLDDGFQQRRLLKDVEIVCLDARVPWGPGGLFPRGTLREPPSALARADLVIATRADGRRNLAGLLEEIRHYAGPAPCLATDYAVEGLEDLGLGRASSRVGPRGPRGSRLRRDCGAGTARGDSDRPWCNRAGCRGFSGSPRVQATRSRSRGPAGPGGGREPPGDDGEGCGAPETAGRAGDHRSPGSAAAGR